MIFRKNKPNPGKALRLEAKGDRLLKKGKAKKALKKYRASEQLNPDRKEIYPKLIAAQNELQEPWTEEEFDLSMTWTMKEQELQNPGMKWIYDKLSADYREIQQLVQGLMVAPDENAEQQIIEKIMNFGPKANLPLIDFLLSLKKFADRESPPK